MYCMNGIWYYLDTDEKVKNNPDRSCGFCNKNNREDGHDVCLGELPGVANSCCGHNNPKLAYIQFKCGIHVSGHLAKIIQKILKKIRWYK